MKMGRAKPLLSQGPALVLLLVAAASCSADAKAFDPRDPHSPLQLVRTLELPDVRGRIDHMALDPATNHLFIAEVANGTVDDVDLSSGKVTGRISGLHEPQGVAWLPHQDEIAVACGDGLLRFYRRSDLKELAEISLGVDADNVRVDSRNGDLVVGYGSGALAVIDPATHRIIRELVLPAHPEAFELIGSRVFVNVPDAHEIEVGDLDQGRVISTLSTGTHLGNYPMAQDASGSRIAIAFRFPGILSVMDTRSATTIFSRSICRDADDLYFHGRQIIVVCGEGAVQVVSESPEHGSVRIVTRRGARTGLLETTGNILFIAVPAETTAAEIWQLSFAEVRQSQ